MAWLIDPTERTIRSVGCDDAELEPLRTSDPILVDPDTGDVIYEGTAGGDYFVLNGVRKPLHGPSLIVGTTEDGDDCEPKISYETLVERTDFGTARDGMFFGERVVREIQD